MTLIQHPVLANLEGAILHRVLYNNTNDDGYDNAIIVRIIYKNKQHWTCYSQRME